MPEHNTSGLIDLVFVKSMHQSGSMAVVTFLSELSRSLSEILDKILLFLSLSLK